MFERLYEVSEQTQINFVGYVSEQTRYDFAIIYTKEFFGKPLITCMQTGRSSLIGDEDVSNYDYLSKVFNIEEGKQAEELSLFLQQFLPAELHKEQY